MGTVFFLSSVVRGMCLMVSVAFSVHRTTVGACYPLTSLPIGFVLVFSPETILATHSTSMLYTGTSARTLTTVGGGAAGAGALVAPVAELVGAAAWLKRQFAPSRQRRRPQELRPQLEVELDAVEAQRRRVPGEALLATVEELLAAMVVGQREVAGAVHPLQIVEP